MSKTIGNARTDFRRKSSAQKETRDRILIVCEDEKRSVEYFDALCTDLELTAAEVRVCGEECGSAPSSVYNYAKQAVEKDIQENGQDNAFDRAYCVFDKDDHGDYQSTLTAMKANPKHKGVTVIPITCIPCFEFWILLHFEQTTKPLESRKISAEIKKHLAHFKKESTRYSELYSELRDKMAEAIKHSKIVLRQVTESDTDNPSTNLHLLIEDLLKESKK